MSRRPPDSAAAPLDAAAFDCLFANLAGPEPILAAISGGPDSTALMHALARRAAAPGRPQIIAATVDHGIRPGSRAEAESVGAAARSLGLDYHLLTWSPRPERISQDSARRARYRLLGECARAAGAGVLVTAHTLDDQAETILMRAAAGSGLTGLAGMRPVAARGRLKHVRPFLAVAKARLVATCRAESWAFVEDSSNADPRFARARWRQILPVLAEEGLDPTRLARLSDRLRRADEALDRAAVAAYARLSRPHDGGIELDAAGLAAEADEIALRVLARALRQENAAPIRLERLEACLAGLMSARSLGKKARHTLAGRQITILREGRIQIVPEPPRRRGSAPVTEIAAGAPHSLGIDAART